MGGGGAVDGLATQGVVGSENQLCPGVGEEGGGSLVFGEGVGGAVAEGEGELVAVEGGLQWDEKNHY